MLTYWGSSQLYAGNVTRTPLGISKGNDIIGIHKECFIIQHPQISNMFHLKCLCLISNLPRKGRMCA